MVRNLAVSVLKHQRITTTLPKAKAAQPLVERLITLGKTGSLQARREATALLGDRAVTRQLFGSLAPLFKTRHGGYTRVLHLGMRRGDGAPLALLELTERLVIAPPPQPTRRKKTPPSTPITPSQTPAPPRVAPSVKTAPPEPKRPSRPQQFFEGIRRLWTRRQPERGGSGQRGG